MNDSHIQIKSGIDYKREHIRDGHYPSTTRAGSFLCAGFPSRRRWRRVSWLAATQVTQQRVVPIIRAVAVLALVCCKDVVKARLSRPRSRVDSRTFLSAVREVVSLEVPDSPEALVATLALEGYPAARE